MKNYTYVDKVLYMAILAQESVEGNPKTASALWRLFQSIDKKRQFLPMRRGK